MADPQAALLTQLRNIQTRTGRSIAQLHEQLASTGLTKVGERRSWLMQTFSLGYGDANAVALLVGKIPPGLDGVAVASPTTAGDPLEAIYAGPKAPLRALHEAVLAGLRHFGPFEEAPKKAYVSLRRSKQFAMLGPATQKQLEIGINAKALPDHPRLKRQPPGGMCQATTRVSSADEIDAELMQWLRAAYDAAS